MLPDNILLKIFHYLNLNERTNLRIVNKQFQNIIDSITLSELIVFEKYPPVKGDYYMLKRPYSLMDCVCVYDLEKFFKSYQLIRSTRSLRKLVIFGLESTRLNVDTYFKKLEYLELHNVLIVNPSIVKSSNLRYYLNNESFINYTERKIISSIARNVPQAINVIGLNLYSSLEYLFLIYFSLDLDCLDYCKRNKLFDKLTNFDCQINHPERLQMIIHKFPSLKRLNVYCRNSDDGENDFLRKLLESDLESLIKNLNSNLDLRLFGLRLNKCKYKLTINFLTKLNYRLIFDNRTINLVINKSTLDLLNEYKDNLLDDDFYDLVSCLSIDNNLFDDIYLNFKKIDRLNYEIGDNSSENLIKTLKVFNNLKLLKLVSNDFNEYSNEVLDLLPSISPNLVGLNLSLWGKDKIDFKFLTKFNKLTHIKILSNNPIEQSTIIEFIRNLKIYLIEVYFVKPDNLDKNQLIIFKNIVYHILRNELKLKNATFFIEIGKKVNIKLNFIKYNLKRYDDKDMPLKLSNSHEISLNDQLEMFKFLKFKESNL